LKGAFQFKDYKYTKADIIIYDEAIKVLDNFAGEYIKEWLSNLSIIINNLLQPINLSVEFTADKDFMLISDNNQILKYDALSTGQKAFLSVIFKLGILMQNNKTGLIILDDSLNNIDWNNFKNLIEIIKTLPFQSICVYQGLKEEIENTKNFLIVRENNESKIK
jgi:wobble nucleotide-excising tRNase